MCAWNTPSPNHPLAYLQSGHHREYSDVVLKGDYLDRGGRSTGRRTGAVKERNADLVFDCEFADSATPTPFDGDLARFELLRDRTQFFL
jgi:hypothetical protein